MSGEPEVEDYNEWRVRNGLPVVTIREPKQRHVIYITETAANTLQNIARDFKFINSKGIPVIGWLIDAIGHHQFKLVNIHEGVSDEGLVDVDGVTERTCFNQGVNDYNKKRPLSIMDSDLVLRPIEFTKAYAKGYSSAMIEEVRAYQVKLAKPQQPFLSLDADDLPLDDE